jgi:phytoene/squalene synthetase
VRVHELLKPASASLAESRELVRRYLATRIARWRLAERFLPAELRDDLIALLAWHRLAREVADAESGFERRRNLDELASELELALGERAQSPVGRALSFAVRRRELPEELLRRPLLEWRRDEHLATFETREALLAHARALAVPEGRLLLRALALASPRNDALVDALALGIQLASWLSHLKRDLALGRLRIPVESLARHGVELGALLRERSVTPELARVLGSEIGWARGFFERGWPLCRELGPWRGRELAFVLRWQAASLSALEVARHAALEREPPAGWLRLLACAGTSLVTTAAPRFG